MDKLKDKDLYDNTILVFTADNGLKDTLMQEPKNLITSVLVNLED